MSRIPLLRVTQITLHFFQIRSLQPSPWLMPYTSARRRRNNFLTKNLHPSNLLLPPRTTHIPSFRPFPPQNPPYLRICLPKPRARVARRTGRKKVTAVLAGLMAVRVTASPPPTRCLMASWMPGHGGTTGLKSRLVRSGTGFEETRPAIPHDPTVAGASGPPTHPPVDSAGASQPGTPSVAESRGRSASPRPSQSQTPLSEEISSELRQNISEIRGTTADSSGSSRP